MTGRENARVDLSAAPAADVIGPLTVTDFVRYQGASGDLASIHHDYEVAKSAGYDKPFAPGMYPAALLASWATAWLGASNIRRFRVRFANLVWPGDVLTCHGGVSGVERSEVGATVHVELTCHSQHALALRGWAVFEIPADRLA